MHSLPTRQVPKTIDTKEPPHEVIVWGLLAVHSVQAEAGTYRG